MSKAPPKHGAKRTSAALTGSAVTTAGLDDLDVEKVLDEQKKKGKRQMYVKWKGFDDSHNSWEPLENVETSEVVRAYRKAQGETLQEGSEKEEEEEYRPSKIHSHTMGQRRRLYLVQWQGFPDPKEFTWEPADKIKSTSVYSRYKNSIGETKELVKEEVDIEERGALKGQSAAAATSCVVMKTAASSTAASVAAAAAQSAKKAKTETAAAEGESSSSKIASSAVAAAAVGVAAETGVSSKMAVDRKERVRLLAVGGLAAGSLPLSEAALACAKEQAQAAEGIQDSVSRSQDASSAVLALVDKLKGQIGTGHAWHTDLDAITKHMNNISEAHDLISTMLNGLLEHLEAGAVAEEIASAAQ